MSPAASPDIIRSLPRYHRKNVMPEGPEIRRAANQVAAAIQGKTAVHIRFGQEKLQCWNARLSGHQVLAVETRGKAMLTRLDNGYAIYSHNQLYGRWHCVPAGQPPRTNRTLRLSIETKDQWALLYSASDIEVIADSDIDSHPFISRLGPDVLDLHTTPEIVTERLLSKTYRNRRLGNFLTDQQFVAGLGNYLRCEILHAAQLAPTQKPCELAPSALSLLARLILELPRQSLETEGITNNPNDARKLMAAGATFEEARFMVFRREGESCYQCGDHIRKIRSAGQACYICPSCQG